MSQAVSKLVGSGAKKLAGAAGKRVVTSLTDRMGSVTDRLTEYAGGNGGGLMSAVTGGDGGNGGGGGQGKALKVTNILESIDVGVPVSVAYNQWTQFSDFPQFMKKVESVEQESDEKLTWTAQVLWSHRSWESTIVEQVPDRRIVWTSEGEKGTVDGAVTFHEIGPDLTRIIVNLQYHPKGFVEQVGNLWRAPGRRVRLELKHFARHAMNETILNAEEVQGWRGEIHDSGVTKGPDDEDQGPEGKETEGHETKGHKTKGQAAKGPEGQGPDEKQESRKRRQQNEEPGEERGKRRRPGEGRPQRASRPEREEERPRRREERPRRPRREEGRPRREPSRSSR